MEGILLIAGACPSLEVPAFAKPQGLANLWPQMTLDGESSVTSELQKLRIVVAARILHSCYLVV